MRPVNRKIRKDLAKDKRKAVFDFCLAALLLVVLFPVLIIIAIAIKLESPGPILFRQLRIGLGGMLFPILKFRSMYDSKADLLAARQTQRDDDRITRVGRFLRQSSLDELPQLFNVVAGQMSLVGPRPHAPGTNVKGIPIDRLAPDYLLRHSVKPGLTGMAQVRGYRGALNSFEQLAGRLSADLEYIDSRTLWLDVKILSLTVYKELTGCLQEQPDSPSGKLLGPVQAHRNG